MDRIERRAVVALVFLLLAILTIAFVLGEL